MAFKPFNPALRSVDVSVIAKEEFTATNSRFFGEFGLPAAQQTWADISSGSTTIDLFDDVVFGVNKQVVRHNDNFTNGATTSSVALTVQNWIDIDSFGASYSGTSRLDAVDGFSGFFSGLQANSAENPLATGNRRYGILFDTVTGKLRLREADNAGNAVTMDGTGGNPDISSTAFFDWECSVPASLGAAQFFINGQLTTFVCSFLTNAGGLGTSALISSGSSGGDNRISYHDNFGVTIYESADSLLLSSETMLADIIQVFMPEGRRDYTITLPDGNPRKAGQRLDLIVGNVFGSVTLTNEELLTPEILYNGLRTLVLNVTAKDTLVGINTINNANVYIGFD